MSNSKSLLIGGGALLLVAAGAGVWLVRPASPAEKTAPALAEVKAERARPQAAGSGNGQSMEGESVMSPARNPSSELTVDQKQAAEGERESVLVVLDQAATTYDPAQLPVIDKYLYHADPEIRKAARDSMVVLGDSGAGKFLRKAAESASSEEERKALIEAAEYMELPPMDAKALAEQMKNRANKPARKPQQPGMGGNLPPEIQRMIRENQPDPASPAAVAPAAPAPAPGQ